MKRDASYGIVPLRQTAQGWQVLLVQHRAGHWSLPKGHPEDNESPLETATRELLEETGLQVERLLRDEPLFEEYTFLYNGETVHKRVQYYLALVGGEERLQHLELLQMEWCPLAIAGERATFEPMRALLRQCEILLDI